MNIEMKPIAYIRSPYLDTKDIPRQSVLVDDKKAILEIEPEFTDGMYGFKEGDHMVILFYFHKSKKTPMIINPHGIDEKRGVFATRSPNRPNSIGLTIVKITKIEGSRVEFDGVDMLDGTPVLDIKPYSPGLNPKID